MEIYLVGGAVRDKLLNRPVTEEDYVVVGATVEDMIAKGFKPVGKDFPVFLHPQTHAEYALARTERKISKGYTGFQFYASPEVTLEEDLRRRDLTINAMAMTASGEIIDPYNGRQDLEKKILRHVSHAFVEDPVRVLRVARFMARLAPLQFTIAPETLELMRQIFASGEIDALVPERVWQECVKALTEPAPEKFFETLRECGALKKLFPELEKLYGVPNPPKHHPEIDTGIHTMLVLQQAVKLSDDVKVRFAALLHDVGKGLTPQELWPSHKGHEARGVPIIKTLCKRLKVPRAFSELALMVAKYHGLVHKCLELRCGTILKLLENTDALRRPDRFQKFLLACEADSRGRPGFENINYPQTAYLLKCLNAAKGISIQDLLEKGYQGIDLAEQIRQRRIKAIKLIKYFC